MGDLPIPEMQRQMNGQLQLLMDKRVQNPPAFTMDHQRDSKCDVVSTNEANLKARAKSQRFGFAKHRAQTGQQHGLGSSMGFGKSTSRIWHSPRNSERYSAGARFSSRFSRTTRSSDGVKSDVDATP